MTDCERLKLIEMYMVSCLCVLIILIAGSAYVRYGEAKEACEECQFTCPLTCTPEGGYYNFSRINSSKGLVNQSLSGKRLTDK